MSGRGDPWDQAVPGSGDARARRRRLRAIQDVANELRRPVEAPDLTAAILARVDEERPFVSARTRRLVWISRMGFAASIAVAALGIAMLHSAAPELVTWTHQAQPVSDVMRTAKVEASSRYQSIRTTFSNVAPLAAAGELGLGRREAADAEASEPSRAPWSGADLADARLAPLPPAHGATYLSLADIRGRHGVHVGPADAGRLPGPVISTVRMTPVLMPRPLAADAPPAAAPWGGRLSTAPWGSATVPVMLEPGQLGWGAAAQRMPPDRGGANHGAWTGGARVVDSLMPAGAGAEDVSTAVPR